VVKVLAATGIIRPSELVTFQSRSGPLSATLTADGIQLDFPVKPEAPADPPPGFIAGLGITPRYVGRNAFDYLVEVESDAIVRGMAPDFSMLARVECRGVIVTARSADPAYDFISRFFAPAAGVPEDPVTGSAHCCLADYWHKRLNKTRFMAYQASPRSGVLQVELVGDRVRLGGTAVIVARGELLLG